MVAGILVQCRREADKRSPEAEPHSAGAHRGHTATGVAPIRGLVVIGAVAIGAALIGGLVVIGTVAIGAGVIGGVVVVIGAAATGAAASPSLSADLVFRSSRILTMATTRTTVTATAPTPTVTGMTLRTVMALIITARLPTATATMGGLHSTGPAGIESITATVVITTAIGTKLT